jgi:hypothetical protein
VVGLFLAGCNSKVSKCPTDSWADFGFDDVRMGPNRQGGITMHEAKCGAKANDVEIHGYSVGWEAGVVQFCNPADAKSIDKNFAVCKG